VVVGHDGEGGFGDDLGHRQPQGHMHRDGQNVFRHQHLESEFFDEAIELVLEPFLDGLDLVGNGARAESHAEQPALHIGHFRMVEESQRGGVADFGRGIEQAGHPVARVAHAPEDVRPFAGFQRDAVGAVKARRDEPNPPGRAGGQDASAHDGFHRRG